MRQKRIGARFLETPTPVSSAQPEDQAEHKDHWDQDEGNLDHYSGQRSEQANTARNKYYCEQKQKNQHSSPPPFRSACSQLGFQTVAV
jgi:hypothetical protein